MPCNFAYPSAFLGQCAFGQCASSMPCDLSDERPFAECLGGQKHDDGKPMLHLIPSEPLLAVAEVLTDGAHKYPAAHNWATVPNARERYYNAALRHLLARSMGEPLDEDSGSPHIAHAIANLLFFLHFDLQDFGDGWPAPMPEPHPTA